VPGLLHPVVFLIKGFREIPEIAAGEYCGLRRIGLLTGREILSLDHASEIIYEPASI
jgi:hypothetical protein